MDERIDPLVKRNSPEEFTSIAFLHLVESF
jgi:hypothetical protein